MPEDPLIGQQFANYRIERVLGQGGMARIYYGWDIKLNRPVAIKVIDARYRDNPTFAERFVNEAQAVAACQHENIIQVYYADDQEGFYYFVMEYIDGLDLKQLLALYAEEDELIPHNEVLRIGRAVANALDSTHEQGLIHRDVKPSNVMLAGDQRIVLTDFGLALDMYAGSVGEVFGSSHYISPEQARSSADAIPQSDLYSLGVMLYEMLTGRVPFDDPSPAAVALQHLTQPLPSLRKINPNLSKAVEALLEKALSKTPKERYSTGAELIDELEQTLWIDSAADTVPVPPSTLSISQTSVDGLLLRHVDTDEVPRLAEEPSSSSPTPSTDALLGEQLDEYHIDAVLGRGGMARVYRGHDSNLDRHVAIKVIDSPFQSDSDHIERFKREAQTIAQLEHPHIIRLYRYGQKDDLIYMAMQYIEGVDLEDVLKKYRNDKTLIEPDRAREIITQICEALDYAHEQNVIHRDIKPSNILLNEEGEAFLTDFGLALMTEMGTRGEVFGSPRYIPPEQAMSSANVVPQSDLYSVGVILYEMFTGEAPFDADDPLEIAMKHMSEVPKPPSELHPEISPELEILLLKALEKDPEDRYQSGAEIIVELEKIFPPEQDEVEETDIVDEEVVPVETEASPKQVSTQVDELPPVPVLEDVSSVNEQVEESIKEKEEEPILTDEMALPPPPAAAQIPEPVSKEDEVWLVDEPLPPVPAAVITEATARSSILPKLPKLPETRSSGILLGIGIGVTLTLLIEFFVLLVLR